MAILKVACPHCGRQAYVTQPEKIELNGQQLPMILQCVSRDPSHQKFLMQTVEATCFECAQPFSVCFSK